MLVGLQSTGDTTPMEGLGAFFDFLREREIRFQLVTNNSTLTPGLYVDKMARMGVQVQERDILTSSLATADYVAARFARGAQIYAIGEDGMMDALQSAGFCLGRRRPAAGVGGCRWISIDGPGEAQVGSRRGGAPGHRRRTRLRRRRSWFARTAPCSPRRSATSAATRP